MLHHVPKVLCPVVAGRMECIDHHHIIGSLFGRCDLWYVVVSHYPVGLASHFEQRTSKPRFKIHDENREPNSELGSSTAAGIHYEQRFRPDVVHAVPVQWMSWPRIYIIFRLCMLAAAALIVFLLPVLPVAGSWLERVSLARALPVVPVLFFSLQPSCKKYRK